MVQMPDAIPSNVRDTKREARGTPGLGQVDDATPELKRKKEGNWATPKGPGGPAPPEPKPVAPTKSPLDDDPPPGSPFLEMPGELRRTLKQSYRDRMNQKPGADKNLDNLFWKGPPAPTLWAALDDSERIGETALNLHVCLYERIIWAYPGFWSQVKYVKNVWYGGSAGFGVVWEDRVAAEAALKKGQLDAKVKVARDEPHGAAEHQNGNKHYWQTLFSDEDCHCWRETGVLDREGLHFCVSTSDPEHDNVHVDWKDPCKGRKPDGMAEYDWGVSAPHWVQAKLGMGVPPSPFWVKTDYLARVAKVRELGKTVKPRPTTEGGGAPDPPDFNLWANDAEADLRKRWLPDKDERSYRLRLACLGYQGRDKIREYVKDFDGRVSGAEADVKYWQNPS